MSIIKLKVEVDPVIIRVEKEDFKDAWQEHCEENGDVEEGEDAGEPDDDFVIERVHEEIDDGTRDLSEVFESASIDVTKVN